MPMTRPYEGAIRAVVTAETATVSFKEELHK